MSKYVFPLPVDYSVDIFWRSDVFRGGTQSISTVKFQLGIASVKTIAILIAIDTEFSIRFAVRWKLQFVLEVYYNLTSNYNSINGCVFASPF